MSLNVQYIKGWYQSQRAITTSRHRLCTLLSFSQIAWGELNQGKCWAKTFLALFPQLIKCPGRNLLLLSYLRNLQFVCVASSVVAVAFAALEGGSEWKTSNSICGLICVADSPIDQSCQSCRFSSLFVCFYFILNIYCGTLKKKSIVCKQFYASRKITVVDWDLDFVNLIQCFQVRLALKEPMMVHIVKIVQQPHGI